MNEDEIYDYFKRCKRTKKEVSGMNKNEVDTYCKRTTIHVALLAIFTAIVGSLGVAMACYVGGKPIESILKISAIFFCVTAFGAFFCGMFAVIGDDIKRSKP